MKKYLGYVIDDSTSLRDMLVEQLRFNDFEAHGYAEAETFLRDVFSATSLNLPDLIVVDLKLRPSRMQGINLVSELADREVPSEILVISGNQPSKDLVEAIRIGAATSASKPFDSIFKLTDTMVRLAEIGKRRRRQSLGKGRGWEELDTSREHRPVFLSHSSQDKRIAHGIRRNLEARDIGVWYAPSILDVGDKWRNRIENGIDQATVFIALITEAYVASPICLGELTRYFRRIQVQADNQLLLLPVLVSSSTAIKRNDLIRPIFDGYHYLDLSTQFIDGLTVLLARIQRSLGGHVKEGVSRVEHKGSHV
ncbi:hypothetical protein YTPLAS18_00890 [Nitrospira sp.]|nr:hypothetical protein YTPLAS18_00890 [Nitrospira sp.]